MSARKGSTCSAARINHKQWFYLLEIRSWEKIGIHFCQKKKWLWSALEIRPLSSRYKECKALYSKNTVKTKIIKQKRSKKKKGFSVKNECEWFDLLFLPYLLWHQQDPGAHRGTEEHSEISTHFPFNVCTPLSSFLYASSSYIYTQTH